jgi:SAM-dependent methyltransferase
MDWPFFRRWFPGETNQRSGLDEELNRRVPQRGKLLDLGCGAHTHLIRFHAPEREAWGVDFQEHPQLNNRAWFRRLRPGGAIPFPAQSFDLVLANMVLEHVGRPTGFLSEVARVLRPGGCLVAQTVSSAHYVTWLRRLLGTLPHALNQRLVRKLYGRAEQDTFPAYYRLNTPGRIARAARPLGLELECVRRYASQGYFEFSRWLFRAAVVTDWCLEKLSPGLGRLYFTVVLRKNPAWQEGVKAAA